MASTWLGWQASVLILQGASYRTRHGVATQPSATLATLLAAATKLLWMKRHEPDNFARLAHVLLPHDYINWWLTGRLAMEVGCGCC